MQPNLIEGLLDHQSLSGGESVLAALGIFAVLIAAVCVILAKWHYGRKAQAAADSLDRERERARVGALLSEIGELEAQLSEARAQSVARTHAPAVHADARRGADVSLAPDTSGPSMDHRLAELTQAVSALSADMDHLQGLASMTERWYEQMLVVIRHNKELRTQLESFEKIVRSFDVVAINAAVTAAKAGPTARASGRSRTSCASCLRRRPRRPRTTRA